MNKVLLTGANGLLGSHIAIQLSVAGYTVKAVVRAGKATPLLKKLSCEIIEKNITDPEVVNDVVEDCDFIIHTAAKTSPFPSNLKAFYQINVETTQHLIAAALKYKVKRFIYVSTANCFTNGTKEQPGTENSSFMPWLKGSAYAYSKYLAHQAVLQAVREQQLPALILCPAFIIGPFDYKPSSGQLLLYFLNNSWVFYPPGGKSFVDAIAAASAIKNALTAGRVGECYLLAGDNRTYREFFVLAQKMSGRKTFLIPVPAFLLLLSGYLGFFLEKLGWVNKLSIANAKMLCLPNYFSAQKAKDELKLPDTSLEKALQKSYDWFKENQYF